MTFYKYSWLDLASKTAFLSPIIFTFESANDSYIWISSSLQMTKKISLFTQWNILKDIPDLQKCGHCFQV